MEYYVEKIFQIVKFLELSELPAKFVEKTLTLKLQEDSLNLR